jgi:hypothetical protein
MRVGKELTLIVLDIIDLCIGGEDILVDVIFDQITQKADDLVVKVVDQLSFQEPAFLYSLVICDHSLCSRITIAFVQIVTNPAFTRGVLVG